MAKVELRDGCAIYKCPGCKDWHGIPVDGTRGWTFSGTIERPTIAPSVLERSGHHMQNSSHCYCKYNAEHPDNPQPFTCHICHHFVRDGKIEFLTDSTHELAGQTVEMLETHKLEQ